MTNEEIARFFDDTQAYIQGHPDLRAPQIEGVVWLLHSSADNRGVFTVGTMGVLLMLLLGAVYSLALGYNYRYNVLKLANLEVVLGIRDAMLLSWRRSKQDVLDRYKSCCCIPWCMLPEVIKVARWAFLAGIAGVTVAVDQRKEAR